MDSLKPLSHKVTILESPSLQINDIIDRVSEKVDESMILKGEFADFLKILQSYKLKQVARNCSNFYFDSKENITYNRKETTAEHIYSSQKLADYFIFSIKEFSSLDRLKVYDLLLYHDDIEIETEDTCISDSIKRKTKDDEEISSLPILSSKYPTHI
jgi:hypothetical protein